MLKKGFTLVELLVVISIISLLLSIMLPSLSNAREAGRRVHCQSNLRSLTLAWNMYTMENRDFLCSPDTLFNDGSAGDGLTNHWVADGDPRIPGNIIGGTEQAIKDGVLWPYLNDSKVYKCKTDKTKKLRSYSISFTMGPDRDGDITAQNEVGLFRKITEIKTPADKLVFTDVDFPDVSNWTGAPFRPIYWDCNLNRFIWRGVPLWDCIPPDLQQLSDRHGHGINIALADLHIESWKYRDSRTYKIIDYHAGKEAYIRNAEEASLNNQDFERFRKLILGKHEIKDACQNKI